MAWIRFLLTGVMSSALVFGAACGDDDGGTDGGGTGDAGNGTDAGDGDGGTGGDGGGDAAACMTTYTPPTVPTDADCTTMADMDAIAMETYGEMMDQSIAEVAADCGVENALELDPTPGTKTCLEMSTMNAVSDACEDCYVASVVCAIDNCVGPCLADPTSPACNACRCGQNAMGADCTGDFEVCAGINSDLCDMVCLDE